MAKTNCYSATHPNNDFDICDIDGWKVETEYYVFSNPLTTATYINELYKLQPTTNGPFTSTLRVKQQYLCSANKAMFDFIIIKTAKQQSNTYARDQILHLMQSKIHLVDAQTAEINENYDYQLKNNINDIYIVPKAGFVYIGQPKTKATPTTINNRKVYPRDKQTALNALAHADYKCEINGLHPSFIRKNSSVMYTEPHHLVPMAYSDCFSVSLDVEENIVSLCSNCHNQLHYGKDIAKMLFGLYNARKSYLERVGIVISFGELLKMY